MDIALLSVSTGLYSSKRIMDEGEKRGHFMERIDHTKCSVVLAGKATRIYVGEDDITAAFDAVIPRVGTKVTQHGAAIVKQFEMNGVFSTARALSISLARNKVKTMQIMTKKGIPIPKTMFSINPDNIHEQIQLIGGAPVIIKIQEGTQGVGVILAESKKSAKSIIDTFYKLDAGILLQEYIEESNGEDIRAFVIGNKIVASMKRSSGSDEFRSNVHRGGSMETIKLTYEEKEIALRAARYLGLGIAGVDLIRSNRGPLLMEVNASPGLQGIEATSGINIAKKIIEYIENNAAKKR